MTYVSDCCSAPAVEGTLNRWNDYEAGESLRLPYPVAMTYGQCSACKKRRERRNKTGIQMRRCEP